MVDRPAPSPKQEHGLACVRSSTRSHIIGIDEVGYGACAGPLVIAGVLAHRCWDHVLARDSKKMSPKKRETGYRYFTHSTPKDSAIVAILLAEYDAHMVDYFRLGVAHKRLTDLVARALYAIQPAAVVLDGDAYPVISGIPAEDQYTVVGADAQVPAVGAASVVAKVFRDAEMVALDDVFGGYQWKKNKGYASEAHLSAVRTLGATVIHRFSYRIIGPLVSLRLWQYRQHQQEMPAWTNFLLR